MRTIEEIEEEFKDAVSVEVIISMPNMPCVLSNDIIDELRHLLAIAKVAEARERTEMGTDTQAFDDACSKLTRATKKARKGGLFGNNKEAQQ